MSKSVQVLITRAEPWHLGHQHLAKIALKKSDKLVVLVGSVNLARDIKNPFTFEERKAMIEASLESTLDDFLAQGIEKQLSVVPVNDYPYNNAKWLAEVQDKVKLEISKADKVFLTGYEKDESSYYLRYFPQWELNLAKESYHSINATEIRQHYFGEGVIDDKLLTPSVVEFLTKFKKAKKADYYHELCEEYSFIKKYRSDLSKIKYSIPFVTGDAIVVCCGHVLLIERRALPGRGLWALPGGFFKDVDGSQVDTALRELREETKLKVPFPVLKSCIRRTSDFTDPGRSLRWRILTKAIYIVLPDEYELPKVKGSDDAKKAFWMPISEIIENRDKFFEDHFHILSTMIGL